MTTLDGLAVHNALLKYSKFESWENRPEGSVTNVPGLGLVEFVKLHEAKDDSGYGYDGSASQGWEGVSFMVFKVGDRFFRKDGTSDSYYSVRWDGVFMEVNPTIKKVTVYEF